MDKKAQEKPVEKPVEKKPEAKKVKARKLQVQTHIKAAQSKCSYSVG